MEYKITRTWVSSCIVTADSPEEALEDPTLNLRFAENFGDGSGLDFDIVVPV